MKINKTMLRCFGHRPPHSPYWVAENLVVFVSVSKVNCRLLPSSQTFIGIWNL